MNNGRTLWCCRNGTWTQTRHSTWQRGRLIYRWWTTTDKECSTKRSPRDSYLSCHKASRSWNVPQANSSSGSNSRATTTRRSTHSRDAPQSWEVYHLKLYPTGIRSHPKKLEVLSSAPLRPHWLKAVVLWATICLGSRLEAWVSDVTAFECSVLYGLW